MFQKFLPMFEYFLDVQPMQLAQFGIFFDNLVASASSFWSVLKSTSNFQLKW